MTTVAGDGKQSNRRDGSGPGKTTGLNSPWDVLLAPRDRSAGDRDGRPAPDLEVRHLVGRGRRLGRLRRREHRRRHPDHGAIRPAERPGHRREEPLRGRLGGLRRPRDRARQGRAPSCRRSSGSGLFDFGDVDGQGRRSGSSTASAWPIGDGKLYIADSYNNKIKVCDPKTRVRQDLPRLHPGRHDRRSPPVRRAGGPEPGRHDPLRGRHQQPQGPGGRHQLEGGEDPGARGPEASRPAAGPRPSPTPS